MYHKMNSSVLFSVSALISLLTLTVYLLDLLSEILSTTLGYTASFLSAHDLCLPGPLRTLFFTYFAWQRNAEELLSLTQRGVTSCRKPAFQARSHC